MPTPLWKMRGGGAYCAYEDVRVGGLCATLRVWHVRLHCVGLCVSGWGCAWSVRERDSVSGGGGSVRGEGAQSLKCGRS